MEHCISCGGVLENVSRLEKKCTSCGESHFESAKPVAMVMLLKENKVCLIKQAYVSDKFVLIAGYNDMGESMEETVKREVFEEVSCSVRNMSYFKSYFYEKKNLLMFCYICETDDEVKIDTNEVDQFEWFELNVAIEKVTKGSIAYTFLSEYIDFTTKE